MNYVNYNKVWRDSFMFPNKSIFYNFFDNLYVYIYIYMYVCMYVYIYMQMSKNLSAKYYQENKEILQKKLMKDIKSLLKKK